MHENNSFLEVNSSSNRQVWVTPVLYDLSVSKTEKRLSTKETQYTLYTNDTYTKIVKLRKS